MKRKPTLDALIAAALNNGAKVTAKATTIDLPWPPSVNTYWRHVGHKTLLSKQGREYRSEIGAILLLARLGSFGTSPLDVSIEAFPPDLRRRDLDNLPKALFDSLQHAGLYDDDSQIQRFSIERRGVVKGGKLTVTIRERGQE